MKKKLLTSGLLYTLGNLLIQGLAFFTLPIYTRIISKEVFGEFNLYSAWVGLISLFIGLQTAGSLSSAKVTFREDEYRPYAVTALSLSTMFFLVTGIVVFIFRGRVSKVFNLSEWMVVLLFVQSFSSYVSGFLGQYFIQQQKTMSNLLLSALTAVSSVILSLWLIFTIENPLLARIVGQLIPSLLTAIGTMIYFYSRKERIINLVYARFVLYLSIPLVFHHLGHQLLNQLDRIMIGKMLSVEEVANYSFGYNIGLVIQIVLNSINVAWVPWFFEARKSNQKTLSKSISYYLSAGLFLTLGYLTIFPELANLLGGKAYQESHGFIGMIVVSYFFVFLYTFPVNIQFYHANTRYIPIGTLFAAGINFILNYYMIPTMGTYGSAFATVLSYLSLLLFHHLLSRKLYKYKDVSIGQFLVLSSIALLYSILMSYFVSNLTFRWGCGIGVLFVYGFLYRKPIKVFLKSKLKGG